MVHHEHPVALAVERCLRSDVLEPRIAQLKSPGTLPPPPLARSLCTDSARRGIHRARSLHLPLGRVASVSETAQSKYAKNIWRAAAPRTVSNSMWDGCVSSVCAGVGCHSSAVSFVDSRAREDFLCFVKRLVAA